MDKARSIRPWWIAAAFLGTVVMYTASIYNHLVHLDQEVQAAWAQVETVYQRRNDLIPNLVTTVKGAANFEKSTLESVTAARAQVTHLPATQGVPSVQGLNQYQAAQDGLSSALTRLFAVAEAYPSLTATANFRDLQTQLEGTENRIAVERRNFNESARHFNATRQSFPTNIIASMFGTHFDLKPYFQAAAGADKVPVVSFE